MPSFPENGVQRLGLNVFSSHHRPAGTVHARTPASRVSSHAGPGQIGLCPERGETPDGRHRCRTFHARRSRDLMCLDVTRESGYPRRWECVLPCPVDWALFRERADRVVLALCPAHERLVPPESILCTAGTFEAETGTGVVCSTFAGADGAGDAGRRPMITAAGSGRAAAAGWPVRARSRPLATTPDCARALPSRSRHRRLGCASWRPTGSGASSRSTRS